MSNLALMAALDLTKDVIVRWDDVDQKHIPLLQEGGVTGIVSEAPTPEFVRSCADAGISVVKISDLRFVSLDQLESAVSHDPPAILEHGLWPGAGRPPDLRGRDYEVAGASGQPWIDANLHWVAWMLALDPLRPAVLGYLPDSKAGLTADRLVPYETLELALVEARVGGGNYILALEPRYREALLGGDPKAVAAWRELGRTARWIRANAVYLAQPTVPIMTALVESGEETAEIANLLFRQNASPALEPVVSPPAPDPRNRLAFIAVNLREAEPSSAARILGLARSGSTVVLDDGERSDWWRGAVEEHIREEHDRDFFRVGRGQLVVYRERIADPSEFALDAIDLVGHPRRAVRLWGAGTVIALAKTAPPEDADGAKRSLTLVNYGNPIDSEILVRVQGNCRSAELLRPESGPIRLQAVNRGTTTEISIPNLRRTGIVLLR